VNERISGWLGHMPRRRSTAQRIWLCLITGSLILVAAGAAVLFGIAGFVPKSELPLQDTAPAHLAAVLAVTGIIGLLIALVGNSLARTQADHRRSHLLQHLPNLVLEEAMDEVLLRRAHEREQVDPRPPLPAPLGVSDVGRVNLAANWLSYFGIATEVDVRRGSGADVHAEHLLARVVQEHEDPKAAMRDIATLAMEPPRIPTAFLSALPPDALLSAAREAGLAVFVMCAEEGSIIALSDEAVEIQRADHT